MIRKETPNDALFIDKRKQQAGYLVIAVMMITLGVLIILLKQEVANLFVPRGKFYDESQYNRYVSLFALTGAMVSLTGIAQFMFYYLRFGLKLPISMQPEMDFKVLKSKVSDQVYDVQNKLSEALDKISFLEKKVGESSNRSITNDYELSPEDRLIIVSLIHEKLREEGATKYLENVEAKYLDKIREIEKVRMFSGHYQQTSSRISNEIEALGRRGNVNLIIGSMAAIVGMLILAYFVFTAKLQLSTTDNKDITNGWWIPLAEFMPRLSLVILIEMLAYFFLRLYKSSLDGIKYFQNELTNSESKFIGLEGALTINDTECIRDAISHFSKTERNFILKKDESTVEVEKARLENALMREMVTSLSGVVPKKSGKVKENE